MNNIFLLRNIILGYDLSKFVSNQYGLGLTYTDIFTQAKIFFRIEINRFTTESLRKKRWTINIASMGFKFV
jgi:hypothetical protein